jgi:hypothetical protein
VRHLDLRVTKADCGEAHHWRRTFTGRL